jgi:hypothetical protein
MLSPHSVPGNNLSLNDHWENVPGTTIHSPLIAGCPGRFDVAASTISGFTSVKALVLSFAILALTPSQPTAGHKAAVDPNGILSPGKQGMWPAKYKHFRDPTGKEADPSSLVSTLVLETANSKL